MINLHSLKEFRYPVGGECISPDLLEGKTAIEIENLDVYEGNKQRRLRELFRIQTADAAGETENPKIMIHGDMSKVRGIGTLMGKGEIIINGNAGMHLGEKMEGGTIKVNGDAGSWAGSMMKSGTIEIKGNAGDYLGAPYRGSTNGMQGGKIIVQGNAGNEAGSHMKKGVIRILGDAGQFAGFRMTGGTIQIQKNCKGRAGACMVNGKIIIAGVIDSVLPTFTIDSVKEKVKIEDEIVEGPFLLFLGDISENGNGKLYVCKDKNPQLSHYETLL